MPEIHLVFSDGRTRKIELSDEELRLGRDSDNDFVLEDEGVSRHHAKIEKKENHFFIVDLDSANGTIVNGKKEKRAS
jgi:pSer/pThr/pTyr-binding forkhead associated (FHA) protein